MKYGEYLVWYFLIYIILCNVPFTNLFVGVLLESFISFLTLEKAAKKRLLKGSNRRGPKGTKWN